MSYRSGQFWQPDVTVATVVERDGLLLMVEERVAGNAVFNQPAGHLEPDESIVQAAIRETLEETGWQVEPQAFIGAYQWAAPESGRHYLRMAFAAAPVAHLPERRLQPLELALHGRNLALQPLPDAAVDGNHARRGLRFVGEQRPPVAR